MKSLFKGISTLLGFSFIVLMPDRNVPVLSRMGQHSMDVYFWYWLVFYALLHYLHIKRLYDYGITGKFIYLLIAIGISALLSTGWFRYPLEKLKEICYIKAVR